MSAGFLIGNIMTQRADNLRYLAAQEKGAAVSDFSPGQQQVLDQINQKIAAGQSLADIMDFLFDALRNISRCDRLGLAFLEEDNTRVVAHMARASYEPILLAKGYTEDLAGSSLEAVIRNRKPRIINNLVKYLADHPQSHSTRLIVEEGIVSSMTCPLFVENRVVGLFFRSSKMSSAYDDTQVAMQEAIAERLSQAVEKARIIEKLEQTTAAYLELLGFVSHELKSPLQAVVMDTYSLHNGIFGPLNTKQKDAVERIDNKAQYITNMVREYLDLSRMESGAMSFSPSKNVNFVRDVIEPAVEIVAPIAQKASVCFTYNIEDVPLVSCDAGLMKIVMVNLLSNAVKYGDEKKDVVIEARLDHDILAVSVTNEGPGFEPAQRQHLFKKFSRLSSPELMKKKGTGLGLYACWKIVKLHGGGMQAESEPGKWARFGFTIPAAGTQ